MQVNTRSLLEEAIQYHQSGDLDNALALYTKFLKNAAPNTPGIIDALQLSGVIYSQQKNFQKANKKTQGS